MNSWVSWTLLLLLALQAFLVVLFSWHVSRRRHEMFSWIQPPNDDWPTVEVVLCLRGADSSLKPVLESLSQQQYQGDWRLQIVVDSVDDPSWKIIEEVAYSQNDLGSPTPTWDEINVQTLLERPSRGSLKCASLLQAFDGLDSKSAFVVLIDADAVVNCDWLSKIIFACCQKGIGAVSGNRWFMPKSDTLAGWTRAVWNSGALVLMTLFSIPWGGSLAVRREVIEANSWKHLLRHGLCEDTGLLEPLKELGLRYLFCPDLLVVDESDDINFIKLFHWIKRQLMTARLHHSAWPFVALHGMGTFIFLMFVIIKGDWLFFLAYEIGCIFLLIWIEMIALQRSIHSLRGWLFALLPGQLVNGWATFVASWTQKVEWSNVIYHVTFRPRGVVIMRPQTRSLSE